MWQKLMLVTFACTAAAGVCMYLVVEVVVVMAALSRIIASY
jgi:hypothetical protein